MHNSASTSPITEQAKQNSQNNTQMQKETNNEFCFTLTSTLQNSLELKETLTHFYQLLGKAIDYSGMSYQHKSIDTQLSFGNRRAHKVNYSLKNGKTFLGDITFYGAKRFAETELETIESLLGILIPPLRNALLYRDAINKSLLDPLTQVGNRAAMEQSLKREFILAKRNEQPVSLLMVDIDHFKQINDTNGHQLGDKLLIKIAETLKSTLRETDQVFRYGGEEFIVILSNTTHYDGLVIADRMRQAVEGARVNNNGNPILASVSIGVSTSHDCKNQEHLIQQADKALYRAKDGGRNRVESSRMLDREKNTTIVAQRA